MTATHFFRVCPVSRALAMVLCGCAALSAQTPPVRRIEELIPFEQWAAEREVRQIPWHVRVAPPQLTFLQWPLVSVAVEIPAKYVNRSADRHDLVLIARLADESGRWVGSRGVQHGEITERLKSNAYLRFDLEFLVLPGGYTLHLALYDHPNGQRSVTRRRIEVRALRKDPLPDADRDLPRVQFLEAREGIERYYRPEVPAALWLPVNARRPLRAELIVNFTPSEQYIGSLHAHRTNLAAMLGALQVLSQLRLERGSLRVTGLDLMRRQVLFEQTVADRLDWNPIREAVERIHPNVISARALGGQNENAAFFRNFLARKLEQASTLRAVEEGDATNGSASPAPVLTEPKCVLILVSSGVLFRKEDKVDPVSGRGCSVFHLQFRIREDNLWDRLSRLLRPLAPKRYVLETPEDFRRALAKLVYDLARLE